VASVQVGTAPLPGANVAVISATEPLLSPPLTLSQERVAEHAQQRPPLSGSTPYGCRGVSQVVMTSLHCLYE